MVELSKAIINRLFSIRLFGGLLAGLIIAVLLSLAIGTFAGFIHPTREAPYFEVLEGRVAAPLFIIVFCAFSLLFYLLTYKEREDILTPLRERMMGPWRIEYQNFFYDQQGGLRQERRVDVCTIGIDPDTAKLFIVIDLVDGPYLRGGKTRIDDITLNPALVPKRMVYFYELDLAIEPGLVARHNLPTDRIKAPVCVVLEIDEPNDHPRIDHMHGSWHDLNGVFSDFFEDLARRENVPAQVPLPTRGGIKLRRIGDMVSS